jgi:hypothetical protein
MHFSRGAKSVEDRDKPIQPPTISSHRCSTRFWLLLSILIILILGLGLGIGLGLGLRNTNNDNNNVSDDSGSPSPPTSGNTTTPGINGTFWQPPAGSTWQIVLQNPLSTFTPNISIYDIDLFTNNASTITHLHSLNSKVICYFSAGSYEPNRPDSKDFLATDSGKDLIGWPGEKWLDTRSENVRTIMKKRIVLASEKGCDGIDPDNVDGFNNDSGFPLTNTTALDFLHFLADEAHALKLAIGLKNAGAIVNETTGFLQWVVNEQCVQYNECEVFRPFIEVGKPVLHIEYVKEKGEGTVNGRMKEEICGNEAEVGFSTVLKKMELDEWVETC